LTAVKLDPEPFANGIPSVVGTALSFLVCHDRRF
jgi:hypothetical protein